MTTKQTKRNGRVVRQLLAGLMLCVGLVASAATVDVETAATFVKNWCKAAKAPMAVEAGTLSEPITIEADGQTLAYAFNMTPDGYVIVSSDDRLTPVIAVGSGKFVLDTKSPGYAFMVQNLKGRLAAAKEAAPETRGAELPEGAVANKTEWRTYSQPTRSTAQDVVSDIWVGSFVQSRWSQEGGIYNYYTPRIYATTYEWIPGDTNNVVCGCTATGTAQILRYFEWPQKKVGRVKGACSITFDDQNMANPGSVDLTPYLRGSDGNGSAYDWSKMPLVPNTDNLDDEQRQMIGALCFDAGLSVGMGYSNEGSGSSYTPSTMKSIFQYAGARSLSGEAEARANLDARRPVAIAIAAPNPMEPGHSIVCDGYGRMGGRWYYHLNFGWAGSCDGWYNIEETYYANGQYHGFSTAMGNIFRQPLQANENPTEGQIISGRVVDANGNPVAGVKVSVRKQGETDTFLTMLAWYDSVDGTDIHQDWDVAGNNNGIFENDELPEAASFRNTTDEKGIWAIDKIPAGNYEIVLEKDGLKFAGNTAVTVASGNKWGLDFVATADDSTDSNIAVTGWTYDATSKLVWLECSRPVGDIDIDLSKITINGTALTGAKLYQLPDSNFIVIDVSDLTALSVSGSSTLTIVAKAFTVATIKELSSQVAAAVSDIIVDVTTPVASLANVGTPAASEVTAITRANPTSFDTNARQVTFTVTGAPATATINDFKLYVTGAWGGNTARNATTPPPATIAGFDGTNLVVNVGEGDGYVRANYLPALGTPFLNGDVYHVDTIGPAIIKAVLSEDNKYVDITWNEPVMRNEVADTSLPGTKANDGAVYAYNGGIATGKNYAIWMCGPDKATAGNSTYDGSDDRIRGTNHPAVGAAYTEALTGNKATIVYSGATVSNFEFGRYAYYDANNNNRYDAGEFIFLKIPANLADALKYEASWGFMGAEAEWGTTFEPDKDYDNKVISKKVYMGTPAPAGVPIKYLNASAVKVQCFNPSGLTSNLGSITGESETELTQNLFEKLSEWFTTTSFYVDYKTATVHNYNAATDTMIVEKGSHSTTGTALPASVYFLDYSNTGVMGPSTFLWNDLDGDGVFPFETGADAQNVVLADNPYTSPNRGLNENDLLVTLHDNGGTLTNAAVYAITSTKVTKRPTEDEIPSMRLGFATTEMRVWLEYTPDLERNAVFNANPSTSELEGMGKADAQAIKTPAGVETIEIRPAKDEVEDVLGNYASTGNTTGELQLYDNNVPRVISAIMRYDNKAVQLVFNKRIYGNSSGILDNYQGAMGPALKDYQILDKSNFELVVTYEKSDDPTQTATKKLTLLANTDDDTRSVYYVKGGNYCEIELTQISDGSAYLNAVDGLWKEDGAGTVTERWIPVQLTIKPKNIYDLYGHACETESVVVPFVKKFTLGQKEATLPPEMFMSSGNQAYQQVYLDEAYDNVLYTKYPDANGVGGMKLANSIPKDSEKIKTKKTNLTFTTGGAGQFNGYDRDVYGVYYRDFDGDGRVDAIDLNFKNPYWRSSVKADENAQLYIGSQVSGSNFLVYVQSGDPNDYDDADKQYYPPSAEISNWDNVFQQPSPTGEGNDPFDSRTLYSKFDAFKDNYHSGSYPEFAQNWKTVSVSNMQVITNTHVSYSTIRLTLNQSVIPPRTYGDRWIMVAYMAPKYSHKQMAGAELFDKNYDWRLNGATAIVATSTSAAEGAPNNPPWCTTENIARWGSVGTNADEEAGIYWKYNQIEANAAKTYVPAYFMVDSFGPIMAWDGAEPVATAAVAWRATPYSTSNDNANSMNKYEYVDVAFSEPIAFANDKGMDGCGYTDGLETTGFLYGAWGAEVIDGTTVRFKFTKPTTSRTVNFSTSDTPILISRNGGFSYVKYEYDYQIKVQHQKHAFRGTAVGVLPVPASRYRVLSHDAGDLADMFTVDASDASLTNISSGEWTYGAPTSSTASNLAVTRSVLRTYTQGGGWNGNSAKWYRNGTDIGTTGTMKVDPQEDDSLLATGLMTYSLLANSSVVTPGAGLVVGIANIKVKNTTTASYPGYTDNNKAYLTQTETTFSAPSAFSASVGYSTQKTPANILLNGPVYVMAKVFPMPVANGTSRIVAGKPYKVLGIDVAGNASQRLEMITVRVVAPSYGHFDPAIDLEPIADNDKSGVQILDASGNTVTLSTAGAEWSAWRVTEAGLPYREVTLRLGTAQVIPTTAGAANSADFYISIIPSSSFNLGDNFCVEIPDNGIVFNTGTTKDSIAATWGIVNGMRGFMFTDAKYADKNSDDRWGESEPITDYDSLNLKPVYDGGVPYPTVGANKKMLMQTAFNPRNLFYAKKAWATNPESYPFFSYANSTVADDPAGLAGMISINNCDLDLDYNIAYEPGDALWYEIGGTYGVYDEGIDLPLFANADQFVLPWSVAESGARSQMMTAAAPVNTHPAAKNTISAPSGEPVAVVGLNMQDSGRGFGPRYILDGDILVEVISKNITSGNYVLSYKQDGTLAWNDGAAVALNTEIGARTIVEGANGTFIVVRSLTGTLPTADIDIPFVVSTDIDRDIQQPAAITGVRIHAVGRGNAVGSYTLTRSGNTLSWNGGAAVDVTASGIHVLNADREDYLVIEVTQIGGAASEVLAVYESEGRNITPFKNIGGLEIMAVSDMVSMGNYTFSYDGSGSLSWGSGAPVKVTGEAGEFFLVPGDDGVYGDYPRSYVVVRRTVEPLPSRAVTDSMLINQSRLLRVEVTITNVDGIALSDFASLTNDETSGVSLWWDADADGKFGAADMFVKLLETPELKGSGNTYSCVLVPDPTLLTAWLSCPQDASISSTGSNFFVCVQTTGDMSYGDKFSVRAKFYEPTETDAGGTCFADGNSGTITCTSLTNTILKKMTAQGQTVDADTLVPIASIDHYLKTKVGDDVYVTGVTLTVHGESAGFKPSDIFKDLDDADAAKRGILLYFDANGNGNFNANDTLIPCKVFETDNGDGTWTYKLLPEATGGAANVPVEKDDKPDHFVVFNMSDALPYGVAFKVSMDKDSINYFTGVGSATNMVTDILTSTVDTSIADVMGVRMMTDAAGVVINAIPDTLEDGYHKLILSYDPVTDKYTMTFGEESVELDMTQKAQYTLDGLTFTFDPIAFQTEDTPVNGLPPAQIKRGAKLISLADAPNLTYVDSDGNGAYTKGEMIVLDGATVVYAGTVEPAPDVASATMSFSASDKLAFFDEDGDAVFDDTEIIFNDTDLVYTLPWMDCLLDSDNVITAAKGAPVSINVGDKLVDAATVSIDAGANAPAKALYLYYIDTVEDGRGYVREEDILVARSLNADEANPELTYGAGTDAIVLDPAYTEDEYAAPMLDGLELKQLQPKDYVRFAQVGDTDIAKKAYEQGEGLFMAFGNEYALPAFEWLFRTEQEHSVRRYSPNAPAPFNRPVDAADLGQPTGDYALAAVLGLDIANGGANDVKLTQVTVRFHNVRGFVYTEDLRPLANDITSGVQIWRDMDGNGVFNTAIDKLVPLGAVPAWTNDGSDAMLTLSLEKYNDILNAVCDNVYDYFIVVQASETANSQQELDAATNCDQFQIYVKNEDIVLNKTSNKTTQISKANAKIISIDSKPPKLVTATAEDSDADGYLETLTMTFDEPLAAGMLEDVSIWNITDTTTNSVLPVKAAELSEDYMTVTLTFVDHVLGSTTGIMELNVAFNSSNALVDWAGNPADLRLGGGAHFVTATDTVAPVILHTGLAISDKTFNKNTVRQANKLYYNGVPAGWNEGDDFWYGAQAFSYDDVTDFWTGGDDVWTTLDGDEGCPFFEHWFYFHDANLNGEWDEGEDIWVGGATYASESQKVWSGAATSNWTTPIGYADGLPFETIFYCDADGNGYWTPGEFLWIDVDGDGIYIMTRHDIAIPQNRLERVTVLDMDKNGKLDTLKVVFSEKMNDTTITGYDPAQDTFAVPSWTLEGRENLKAMRQGYDDADTNNDVLYFTFDEAEDVDGEPEFDTGNVPTLTIANGETYADMSGNVLYGSLMDADEDVDEIEGADDEEGEEEPVAVIDTVIDAAPPVLVEAKSTNAVTAGGILPSETVLTFVFSEPLKQVRYTGNGESTIANLLSCFLLYDRDDAIINLGALLDGKATLELKEDNRIFEITLTADVEGLADVRPMLTVDESTEDSNSIFTDAADNRIYIPAEGLRIAGFVNSDLPEIILPVANAFYRGDDLKVKVAFNDYGKDNEFHVTEWKLDVLNVTEGGNEVLTATKTYTVENVDELEGDDYAAFVMADGWMVDDGENVANYILRLSFDRDRIDASGRETIVNDVPFTAIAAAGVLHDLTLRDGGVVGTDVDAVKTNSTAIWANWDVNDLVVRYEVEFINNADDSIAFGPVEITDMTQQVAKFVLEDPLVAGDSYKARIRAYNDDDQLIADGESNGFTVVETIADEPFIKFVPEDTRLIVQNTNSEYTMVSRQIETDRLYAKWNGVADNVTAPENMRYRYRVLRSFGAAEWQLDENVLESARQKFSTAVVDGKLYAIGGVKDNAIDSVEIYNPDTRSWTMGSSLNAARYDFGCVTLPNSRVLVIGGVGSDYENLTSAEIFNGETGTWTLVPDVLPEGGYDRIQAVADGDDIWLVGSRYGVDDEGEWTITTDVIVLDSEEMTISDPITLEEHAAADFQVAKQTIHGEPYLVIAGGYDITGSFTGKITRIKMADASMTTAEFETARQNFAMLVVADKSDLAVDNVWFIGGQDEDDNYLKDIEVLEGNGEMTKLKDNEDNDASLNVGRSGAVAIWNKELQGVMVIGGFTADSAWRNWTEVSDMTGATWRHGSMTQLQDGCIGHELVAVENRLLIVGGYGQDGEYIVETESCDWMQSNIVVDWTDVDAGVNTVALTEGIELQEGVNYVFEVKAIDEAGQESDSYLSHGVIVSSSVLNLTFTPDLADPSVTGTEYTVAVGQNEGGSVENICYELTCTDTGEVVVPASLSQPISTAIELPALEAGEYNLKVWDVLDDEMAQEIAFTVAAAEFAVAEYPASEENSFTFTRDTDFFLHGLAAYDYQLDNDESTLVENSTDDQFTVSGIGVGYHAIKLWGIDANGNRQAEPAALKVFVKTQVITGDPLTATITSTPAVVWADDADTISYTLTMSEAVVITPVAGDFEVANGAVNAVTADDETNTVFTVTVTPNLGTNTAAYVALTLKSDKVFSMTGVSNQASEPCKVLYCTEAVATFTPSLSTTGDIHLGQIFTLNIDVAGNYALLGGDIAVMFDSTVFWPVFETSQGTDEKGNEVPTAAEFLNFDYTTTAGGTVCEWIYDGTTIIGIRIGGSKYDATATAITYVSIPFRALKETEGSVIAVQALNDPSTDAGLAFKGLGLTDGEFLDSVEYGDVTVPVILDKPLLQIAVLDGDDNAVTTATEGGDAVYVTATLAAPIAEAIDVAVTKDGANFGTLHFTAGNLVPDADLEFAVATDGILTGDVDSVFAISCASTAVTVSEATATVTAVDVDGTTVTATPSADEVNEGESLTITVALPDGLETAGDVTFNSPTTFTVAPATFKPGIDFRIDAEPVIAVGETSCTITVTTYRNTVHEDDYVVTLNLNGMKVGDNPVSGFAGATCSFTVVHAKKPGDIANDDGVVNQFDLLVLLSAIGSTEGEDNWDASCDLNGDGIIDYRDLLILLSLIDVNASRSAGRLGSRSDVEREVALFMTTEKTSVAPGDEITVTLWGESSFVDYAIGGVNANVNWKADELEWNGEFVLRDVVDPAFNLPPFGTLRDDGTGIEGLCGSGAYPNTVGQNGEPFVVATLTLRVKDDTTSSAIVISLDGLFGTTYGGGFSSHNGTLDISATPLVLTVGEASSIPPFTLQFRSQYSAFATRASDVELALGMTPGATIDDDGDFFGDAPAGIPFPMTYDVRFVEEGRATDMKWDMRGVSNAETWNATVKVPAGARLTLDYSDSVAGLPDYFTYTFIDAEGNETDLVAAETKKLVFEAGAAALDTTFRIVVEKKPDQPTHTYRLDPGWNLIGVPFELTAESKAKFAGFDMMFCDEDAYTLATSDDMSMGGCFWVYIPVEAIPEGADTLDIKVAASEVEESTAVMLTTGWNWITPKAVNGAAYTVPTSSAIRQIWFYTPEGYRTVTEDEDILPGRAYYILSTKDTTIWGD